jgi:hypothetical protein
MHDDLACPGRSELQIQWQQVLHDRRVLRTGVAQAQNALHRRRFGKGRDFAGDFEPRSGV